MSKLPLERNWHRILAQAPWLSAAALSCAACGSAVPNDNTETSAEHDFFAEEAEPERSFEPASPPDENRLTPRQVSVTWSRWTKGEPPKTLSPFSTHVCGLAMVRGEFKTDTNVRITRASGGNWAMAGANPGSNTLQMEAVCVPHSAFEVNPGRTVASTDSFAAIINSNNSEKTIAMPARTAPILTGIWGHFEGGGERSQVSNTTGPAVQAKKGTVSGAVAAYATSLSFGLAPLETVRYGGEFHMSLRPVIVGCDAPPGSDECEFGQIVGHLSSDFCFLASVSGDFNGADEWIQVYPRFADGTWRMQGFAASGNGVTGIATCVDVKQAHSCCGEID